jgi:hypothetical protein
MQRTLTKAGKERPRKSVERLSHEDHRVYNGSIRERIRMRHPGFVLSMNDEIEHFAPIVGAGFQYDSRGRVNAVYAFCFDRTTLTPTPFFIYADENGYFITYEEIHGLKVMESSPEPEEYGLESTDRLLLATSFVLNTAYGLEELGHGDLLDRMIDNLVVKGN